MTMQWRALDTCTCIYLPVQLLCLLCEAEQTCSSVPRHKHAWLWLQEYVNLSRKYPRDELGTELLKRYPSTLVIVDDVWEPNNGVQQLLDAALGFEGSQIQVRLTIWARLQRYVVAITLHLAGHVYV